MLYRDMRCRFCALPILVVCCAFIVVGCRSNHTTLVIGGVLPMTGDAATFGQNAAHGAELAVKDATDQHLLPGLAIKFEAQDSRGQAGEAVSAANELIDVGRAKLLVGDVTSAGTQAIIPIVTRARIPLISPAASDPSLSGASPYFARVWPSDTYEAKVIGGYAKQKAYSRIAMLYANTDYGVAMIGQFKGIVPSGSIGLDISVDRGLLDYRPTIQRIKLSKADAIFFVLYPEDAQRFLQQLSEQRVALPMMATATFEDPHLAQTPGADRVVFASPVPPSDTNPIRKAFVDEYTQTFHVAPGVLSDTGYDSAMILIKAYAARGSAGSPAVMEYVRALHEYPGVSGTMTFDQNGDVEKPYQLKTVQNGKFVWLSK